MEFETNIHIRKDSISFEVSEHLPAHEEFPAYRKLLGKQTFEKNKAITSQDITTVFGEAKGTNYIDRLPGFFHGFYTYDHLGLSFYFYRGDLLNIICSFAMSRFPNQKNYDEQKHLFFKGKIWIDDNELPIPIQQQKRRDITPQHIKRLENFAHYYHSDIPDNSLQVLYKPLVMEVGEKTVSAFIDFRFGLLESVTIETNVHKHKNKKK